LIKLLVRKLFFLWFLFLLASGCGVNAPLSSSRPIGHTLWDELLAKHVKPEGKVDYSGFIRDSLRLKEYLLLLESHHPNGKNWSREERLAYWINAYNALYGQVGL
jgi:hypothetical protein